MYDQKVNQKYTNHTQKKKWLCIIIILLSITLIHYFFINKFFMVSKIILFIVFCILALNIFFQKNIGKQTLIFIKDIKKELSSIVWPNYIKTIKTTGIVLLLIILTSVFLWILDGIILYIISRVLISRL